MLPLLVAILAKEAEDREATKKRKLFHQSLAVFYEKAMIKERENVNRSWN